MQDTARTVSAPPRLATPRAATDLRCLVLCRCALPFRPHALRLRDENPHLFLSVLPKVHGPIEASTDLSQTAESTASSSAVGDGAALDVSVADGEEAQRANAPSSSVAEGRQQEQHPPRDGQPLQAEKSKPGATRRRAAASAAAVKHAMRTRNATPAAPSADSTATARSAEQQGGAARIPLGPHARVQPPAQDTTLPPKRQPGPQQQATPAVDDMMHPHRRQPPTPPRGQQAETSELPPHTSQLAAPSKPQQVPPRTPPSASVLGDSLADMDGNQDPLSPEDAPPPAPLLPPQHQCAAAACATGRRPSTAPPHNPMHPADSTLISATPSDAQAERATCDAAASHEVAYLTHEHLPPAANAGEEQNAANEAEEQAGEADSQVIAASSQSTQQPRSPGLLQRAANHPTTPASVSALTPGGDEMSDAPGALEQRDTPAPRRRFSSCSSTSTIGGSAGGAQLTPCCTNHARMPMLSPDGTQLWQQSPAIMASSGGHAANAIPSAAGTESSRRPALPRAHTPVGRLQLPDIDRAVAEADDASADHSPKTKRSGQVADGIDGCCVRAAHLPSVQSTPQLLPPLPCSQSAGPETESGAVAMDPEDAMACAQAVELLESLALCTPGSSEEGVGGGVAAQLARWHELERLCHHPAVAATASARQTTSTVLGRPLRALISQTADSGEGVQSLVAMACVALAVGKRLLSPSGSAAARANPGPTHALQDLLGALEQVLQHGLSTQCGWSSAWRTPVLLGALAALSAPFDRSVDLPEQDVASAGLLAAEVDAGASSSEGVAWLRGALYALQPLLPALLHDTALQTATLSCARALFAAASGRTPSSDQSPRNDVESVSHDVLMVRLELARAMQAGAALRPLCDSLDAHAVATLWTLAALVHTPAESTAYVRVSSQGESARDLELCQAGHGLCCALGQQLLALRPQAISWLAAAPVPTLRVLLHSCRAQPALGSALATDVRLQGALWELATSLHPIDGVPLLALLLLSLLLTHGAQQTTQRTKSEAVQVALPHVPSLARLLAPPSSSDETAADSLTGGAAAACASAAAACLAELLRSDGSAAQVLSVLQAERGDGSLHRAVMWLEMHKQDSDRAATETALRSAEGACFGIPCTRVADGFAALLQRLLLRLPRKHAHLAPLSNSSFWRALASTLKGVSEVGRGGPPVLTPTGTLALVKGAHEALSKLAESSAAKLLHSGLLAALLALLHGPRKEAAASPLSILHATPAIRGGGAPAAAAFLNAVSLALYVPFGSRGERNAQALVQLQQAMYSGELLGVLLRAMPLAEPHEPEVAVGLMSRLVLGSNHFARQYIALGGVQPSVLSRMLGAQRAPSTLTDALLILCQIARLGEQIGSVGSRSGTEKGGGGGGMLHAREHSEALCERLPPLLRHADAGVRAKACNLLGNLCKHSDEFYDGLLVGGGLLPLLAGCCADDDAAVRKFACFAVGNAGFHSARLYSHLGTCVVPLVGCLADADGKTRANAAGALGNLARNGPELCAELLEGDVPRALLALGLQTNGSEAQPDTPAAGTLEAATEAGSLLRAARTALFSLGNLAAHEKCRDALASLEVREALGPLTLHTDAVLRQHASRALQKLEAVTIS